MGRCKAMTAPEGTRRQWATRGTYGWPRVHAELTLGLGERVNHKRVARLMRAAGLQGLYRRRRRGCTVRNPADPVPVDLVNRQFAVEGPDRLWLTDITEHPTANLDLPTSSP